MTSTNNRVDSFISKMGEIRRRTERTQSGGKLNEEFEDTDFESTPNTQRNFIGNLARMRESQESIWRKDNSRKLEKRRDRRSIKESKESLIAEATKDLRDIRTIVSNTILELKKGNEHALDNLKEYLIEMKTSRWFNSRL